MNKWLRGGAKALAFWEKHKPGLWLAFFSAPFARIVAFDKGGEPIVFGLFSLIPFLGGAKKGMESSGQRPALESAK